MKITGGCYCGGIRFEAEGEPLLSAFCYCRECQYISGGNANTVMAVPGSGFKYTRGKTNSFTRSDIDNAVTREFCPTCGTQIGTWAPQMPGAFLLKVGTFDDPGVFQPEMAAYTKDKQHFHLLPEGLPIFERTPEDFDQ